jgi:hypothetical protein
MVMVRQSVCSAPQCIDANIYVCEYGVFQQAATLLSGVMSQDEFRRTAMKHPPKVYQPFFADAVQTRACISRELVPRYRVGEKLRNERDAWPEGGQFMCGSWRHELTLCSAELHTDLAHDFKCGPSEFALIVEPPVFVLAYRFGQSNPWNDISYCWHLQPEEWRVVPPVARSVEARALLWITLVGADDGVIHAQRGVTLSPSFTRILHTVIRNQAVHPFHPEECTAALSKIFLSYPTPADRLALAVARTLGNE